MSIFLNKERLNPITLEYESPNVIFDNEKRAYSLTPFSGETNPLYIKGGDGNYRITNSDESVVHANFDGKKIRLQSQALGNAIIRIEDTANNSYSLSVNVKYRELAQNIIQRELIIMGNELTVGDKAKLENEIKETDLTERYLFTYKDAENSIGSVRIWNYCCPIKLSKGKKRLSRLLIFSSRVSFYRIQAPLVK